jgi:hypothetical protein
LCDRQAPAPDEAGAAPNREVVVLEFAELAGRFATQVRCLDDDRCQVRAIIEVLSWLPAPHRPAA